MPKIGYSIAPLILLGFACLSFASPPQQSPAPEPSHITISAPDPSLPEQIKGLVGKWVGTWDSRFGWDTALYVEKVDKDSAQVVISWGEYNTAHESCHCGPNWLRIRKAEIKQTDDNVTMHFYTPKFRPHWLKASHVVNGTGGEYYGGNEKSSGQYTFDFVIDRTDPGTLKGLFFSAKQSRLRVNMKRTEESKEAAQ
jgi:hypothetical protein